MRDYGRGAVRGEVLVSAGDNFLAGKVFNASRERSRGIFEAEAMNLIGYDAITLGNHDFDFGPATTARFIGGLTRRTSGIPVAGPPPFLSSNLDVTKSPDLAPLAASGRIAASTVVTVRGQRVGLIGATTETLPFISAPGPVVVSAVVLAVQAEVGKLAAAGVTTIVLVSHLQGSRPTAR